MHPIFNFLSTFDLWNRNYHLLMLPSGSWLVTNRGCLIKKCKNVLLHNPKMINPREKSHSKGQNKRSSALKWGFVHLYNSNGFGDMIKNKICYFLEFLHFLQFSIAIFTFFLQKRKIWKTQISIKLVVSLKVIELQRCTIPHFKALDPLFWPLAWLLTLGSIIFLVWSKTFVNLFLGHPLDQMQILQSI